MSFSSETVVIRTHDGSVRGVREDAEAWAFYDLPYAAPPIADRRFTPPRPATAWAGVRDATRVGGMLPQPAARLERIMGPIDHEQGEDALTLNVWTPDVTGHGRPVLVWFHGGGFASGSGALDWYHGARLAAAGGMVVVSVNTRLGALGYLYLAELATDMGRGNFGLLDLVTSLKWVRDNIGFFGGDPDNVTAAGQSGGALSLIAALSRGQAKGLFQRLILQSPPLGVLPMEPGEATGIAERYVRAIGIGPGEIPALRRRPVRELLQAQVSVARETARPFALGPPFQLVSDNEIVAGDLMEAIRQGALDGIDVLVGSNENEAAAFFAANSRPSLGDRKRVEEDLAKTYGIDPWRIANRDDFPTEGSAELLASEVVTELVFKRGITSTVSNHRGKAYVYSFDWSPAGSPFEACHCIELPFVFGNHSAWRTAPMMNGADWGEVAALTESVQRAWISFATSGDPGHDDLPTWPSSSSGTGSVMHFGSHPWLQKIENP